MNKMTLLSGIKIKKWIKHTQVLSLYLIFNSIVKGIVFYSIFLRTLLGASSFPVPEKMSFCGIELTLTPGAREEIQKTVYKLTHKPEYHQELKRRIDIFMPWVEDALKKSGVPEDLKYLVIQESAFVGDAVSSSNAVGFWQFKDFTAREMGLIVNEVLDERKHIYKSTLAAAKYFYQNNRYFDNYLYAVIAYYAGGGGSMTYVNPASFGAHKMTIESDFHWYPLKALAHKIVFENYIKDGNIPEVWLEAKYISPGKSIQEVCAEWEVHPDSFRKYNLWLLKGKLPETGKSQIAFIPKIPEGRMNGTPLHTGQLPELVPTYAGPEIPIPKPSAQPLPKGQIQPFHKVNMLWDEDFRSEYIYIEKTMSIEQGAAAGGIAVKEFRTYNVDLLASSFLPVGAWFRTADPETGNIWIVKSGQSWSYIANATGLEENKLKKLNRVGKKELAPPIVGRKLWLREKAPKSALILQAPEKDKGKTQNAVYYSLSEGALQSLPKEMQHLPIVCTPEGKGVVCKVEMPEVVKSLPPIRSLWVTHEVRKGEEVWLLAKKYDTRGDLIRKVNQLGTDRLKAGMKLKIFMTEANN
jgi:membrane-bound lytic murein transglycosylase D